MKITFLGTGTSSGVPEMGCRCEVCRSTDSKDIRTRTSLLIQQEEKNIIIDCGPDFRQQFLRENLCHIDAVLLTHAHFDHIDGLEELRPATKEKSMPVWCEPYVADQIRKRLHYCFSDLPKGFSTALDLLLFDSNTSFDVAGIEFLPVRMLHHQLPVVGFRFGKIGYLTDFTQISDSELAKLNGVDILIIEALRQYPHIAHISLPQALEYIEKINPSRSYLIHMNHQFGRHEEIQKILPENIIIAYDGLSFEIN